MTGVLEVLPGNICIFYLPQNSGPDILKGNDHRLIKSSQTCFCCPRAPPLHFSLLVFAFFWFNFSKQILSDLKEGQPTPEQAFPHQRVLCVRHGGRALSGGLTSRRSPAGVSPRGKHLSSCDMLSLSPRQPEAQALFAEGISYPHGINSPFLASSLNRWLITLWERARGQPRGWFSRNFRPPMNEGKIKGTYYFCWKVGEKTI